MNKFYELIDDKESIELKEFSLLRERVYRMCEYAKKNVPWYSKNVDKIIDMNKDYFDIPFPILNKDDIRNHFHELLSCLNKNAYFIQATTGSTGSPLKIAWTHKEYNKCTMEVWKWRKYFDANLSDTIIYFWGLPNIQSPEEIKIKRITNNTYEFTCEFSFDAIREYIQFINSQKGVLLHGYPSIIYTFAEKIKQFNFSAPKVNCIELNGEMLMDHEYEVIKEVFGPSILNNYGAREMWPISLTCKYGTNHVCNDLVFVEEDNSELLITSIIKEQQPLVRYRVGDLGNVCWGKCQCGRTSQIITNLAGRKNDYIYLAENEKEHWGKLNNTISRFVLENCDVISEFAVHQKKDFSIEILLVVKQRVENIQMKLLSLCKAVYSELNFSIKIVDRIEQNDRGKRCYFKSDIN